MPNIIEVKYNKTGESTKTNQYGMREMHVVLHFTQSNMQKFT